MSFSAWRMIWGGETRGSCLTGRHPYRYGIFGANRGHLPSEEFTLPEILKEQGYRTGFFGKWHLGTLTKDIKDSNRGGPSMLRIDPYVLHEFAGICSVRAF